MNLLPDPERWQLTADELLDIERRENGVDPEYRARFWRIALPLLAAFWLSVAAGVFIVVRGW